MPEGPTLDWRSIRPLNGGREKGFEELDDFSDEERRVWERFDEAGKVDVEVCRSIVDALFAHCDEEEMSGTPYSSDQAAFINEVEKTWPQEVAGLSEERAEALATLEAALTVEHLRRFHELQTLKSGEQHARRTPRFDLRQIQRYILSRVFEMGWTTERFGHFGRFVIARDGREASKAERVGKKGLVRRFVT